MSVVVTVTGWGSVPTDIKIYLYRAKDVTIELLKKVLKRKEIHHGIFLKAG